MRRIVLTTVVIIIVLTGCAVPTGEFNRRVACCFTHESVLGYRASECNTHADPFPAPFRRRDLPPQFLRSSIRPYRVVPPPLLIRMQSFPPRPRRNRSTLRRMLPDPVPVLTDNQTVTFLLLGSDKRPGQTYFRTDTIIIAAVRPASGQVTLISVPRDLYVYIPTSRHGPRQRSL